MGLTFYEQLKKSHEDNGSFSFDIGEYWKAKSVLYAGELLIEVRDRNGKRAKKIRISDDGSELTYFGKSIPSYVFNAAACRLWEIKESFKHSIILKNL